LWRVEIDEYDSVESVKAAHEAMQAYLNSNKLIGEITFNDYISEALADRDFEKIKGLFFNGVDLNGDNIISEEDGEKPFTEEDWDEFIQLPTWEAMEEWIQENKGGKAEEAREMSDEDIRALRSGWYQDQRDASEARSNQAAAEERDAQADIDLEAAQSDYDTWMNTAFNWNQDRYNMDAVNRDHYETDESGYFTNQGAINFLTDYLKYDNGSNNFMLTGYESDLLEAATRFIELSEYGVGGLKEGQTYIDENGQIRGSDWIAQ
jgi:hypothetical protein